jgi:hypothetical protein
MQLVTNPSFLGTPCHVERSGTIIIRNRVWNESGQPRHLRRRRCKEVKFSRFTR